MAGIHSRPLTPVEDISKTDTQADSAAVTQRTGSPVQSAATGGHPLGGNTASQVKLQHAAQTSGLRARQNYLSQVDEQQKNVPSELKGDIRDVLRSAGQKIPSEALMNQTLALPEAVHFELLAAAGGKVTGAMVDSAIAAADVRSMERLLATGSNPNAVGANGRAVLTRSLMTAESDKANNPALATIVDTLIKTPGINLNHAGPHDLTAVHFAAAKPNVDAGTLKKLIDAGAATNLPVSSTLRNMAPTHLAVQSRHIEALKVLVAAPDYNPDLKDADGNTALDIAKQNLQIAHSDKDAEAIAANQEIVTFLSAHQSRNISPEQMTELNSTMDDAIGSADSTHVARLLQDGANPNAVGDNGCAVLTRSLMAAESDKANNPAVATIVDTLIKTPGINLNHAGPHDLTAVHFAAAKPNVDASTLKKLIDAGAATNLPVGPALRNMAPTHLAVQSRHIEALKVLVAAPDYDPHLKDADGNTALDIAQQNLQIAHSDKNADAVAANQEIVTFLSAHQVTTVAPQHQAELAALNAGPIADASINTDLPADNIVAIRNYLNDPVKQRSTAAHMNTRLTKQLNIALTEKLTQNKPIPEQVMTYALSVMRFDQVRMVVLAKGDLAVRSAENSNSALMMVMARFDLNVPKDSTRSKEEFFSLSDVPAILSVLINEGKADVNSPNNLNMTPLSRALVHGQAAATKVLLEGKADVNYRGPSGRNIMHDLAIGGNADVLAQLKNNPDALALKNTEDDLGNPPIFCTIGHEERAGGLKPNPAAFQFFQDIGVSVHSPNSKGTRMMDVSFAGHLSEEQTLMLVQANAHASQSEKNDDNRLYALMDHPHADRQSFIDNVIRPQLPAFIATGGDPNILERR